MRLVLSPKPVSAGERYGANGEREGEGYDPLVRDEVRAKSVGIRLVRKMAGRKGLQDNPG